MPVDTTKTIMQVHGKEGFRELIKKAKVGGPSGFYSIILLQSHLPPHSLLPWSFGCLHSLVCWSLPLVRHLQLAAGLPPREGGFVGQVG